ncbi:Nucleoside diphosphate-linked moiety X motif 8 [Frankliniella fusca]|uniref:Nucleoside diphosphate-linked moiety X motif 8 n=1 Tax=Frankliniella fusca TaxID=407009 RepID=A0AAE1L8R5_9NEOP|nr:Nucleoside diphosphate-linked moiety X motif 8 [Frankliniella fusca]
MLPRSFVCTAPRTAHLGPLGGALLRKRQVRLPSAVTVDFSTGNGGLHSAAEEDALSPSSVLSAESREACVRRLSRMPSLKPPTATPPGAAKAKEAAILVSLCLVGGEMCLLYTLRSPYMSSHRGQVSFPGGMKDDEDVDYEATALRETEEELGIHKHQVEIWGRCPPMESANRVTCQPVVGYLGSVDVSKLEYNPKEVGDVFTIPLRHFCDKSNFRYTQFRTGRGYSIPVFFGGKYKVWGLTAGVTHIFLTALLPTMYKNKVHYIKPIKY